MLTVNQAFLFMPMKKEPKAHRLVGANASVPMPRPFQLYPETTNGPPLIPVTRRVPWKLLSRVSVLGRL